MSPLLPLGQNMRSAHQNLRADVSVWGREKPRSRGDATLPAPVPYVGRHAAPPASSGMGGISRLADFSRLCPYAGIVSSVRNSADVVRHGRMTDGGGGWREERRQVVRAGLCGGSALACGIRAGQRHPRILQRGRKEARSIQGGSGACLQAAARHLLDALPRRMESMCHITDRIVSAGPCVGIRLGT